MIFIPVRVGFLENEEIVFLVFDIIIHILFITDTILHFFVAYFDQQGNLIKLRKKIKERYFRSGFTLDLISNLPLDYIFVKISTHHDILVFNIPIKFKYFILLK